MYIVRYAGAPIFAIGIGKFLQVFDFICLFRLF